MPLEFVILEEFPTDENLEKVELITDIPVEIVLAAKNIKEFDELKTQVEGSNGNIKRVGYWPLFSDEEGYWQSKFSSPQAIDGLIGEVKDYSSPENPLLLYWAAETPLRKKPSLIISNFLKSFNNQKKIIEFFKEHADYGIHLVTNEMPVMALPGAPPQFFQRLTGTSFDPKKYGNDEIIKGLYSSFYRSIGKEIIDKYADWLLKTQIRHGGKKYRENFSTNLGCLAAGAMGNEPILTPEQFHNDLRIVHDEATKGPHKANFRNPLRVYLFRLGGLTPDYVDAMKEFLPASTSAGLKP